MKKRAGRQIGSQRKGKESHRDLHGERFREKKCKREQRRRRMKRSKSTWQPVTMQIHFKAPLQKVGSDSDCYRENGVLGGDLET